MKDILNSKEGEKAHSEQGESRTATQLHGEVGFDASDGGAL